MSLICSSGEESFYGGEAEHDGYSMEASPTYTHVTAVQNKMKTEAQVGLGSLKSGSVSQEWLSSTCTNLQISAIEGGMSALHVEDVDISFKDKCYLLGEVRQRATTASGIDIPLQTVGEKLHENHCCAHLQAPEGIVSPGVEVTMHYAVILEGPFKLPKGYRRVSSVLFLHCNSANQLKKALSIRLQHWAKICGGKESGLCFMKANHCLRTGESHYDFRPLEGGNFEADEVSGIIHLKDHFCLLCTAIVDSKEHATDRYYAVLCRKRDQEFRICITYAVPSWLKAIQEFYWKNPQEDIDAPTFDYRMFACQHKDDTQRYVDLSAPTLTSASGVGWHCSMLESQVDLSTLDKYRDANVKQSRNLCTNAVEMSTGVFPPSLKFTITYTYGRADCNVMRKPHKVSLKGCIAGEVSFLIEVFEPALDSPEPIKTCNSNECSQAVEDNPENTAPLSRLHISERGTKVLQRGAQQGELPLILPDGEGDLKRIQPFQEAEVQSPEQDTTTIAVVESQGARAWMGQHDSSQFSASSFLAEFENDFLDVVNAKMSLVKLRHKGVIPCEVKASIMGANDDDAKYILYEHLEKNSTEDTLRVYCSVLIAADGFPKMKKLGSRMMEALQCEVKTQPQHGHHRRYVPGASVSCPNGKSSQSWQIIPEESAVGFAGNQKAGSRAQTTPR